MRTCLLLPLLLLAPAFARADDPPVGGAPGRRRQGAEGPAHGRLHRHRRRHGRRLAEGRVGAAAPPADATHAYETRVKVLYSPTGLYVLMDATDRRLTATMKEDFLDLWNEDVFEFFLWPDEKQPVYFEYEISPLGFELPILVPEPRRQVPRLAAVALRRRPQDAQGDLGRRWSGAIRRRGHRLEGRGVHPL